MNQSASEIAEIDHAERLWRKELGRRVRLSLFDPMGAGDPQRDHRLQRRTADGWVRFLIARSTRCATDSAACRLAGIARSTLREWLKQAQFQELYNEAVENFDDRLEEEATRRAVDGTLKPIFYKGRPCGAVREYSDQLLTLLLKARRPKIFRESHNIHIGATTLEDIVAGGFANSALAAPEPAQLTEGDTP